MVTTFPNNVSITPDAFPGQVAGARKPGSSKGYVVTDYTLSTPPVLGVTIGNFVYQVPNSENQCVGTNPGSTASTITGGTDIALATDIVDYATPTLSITVNGTPYTVTPTAFATGDDYAAIATKVQAGLRTALTGTPFASTATVTYTGTAPTAKFTIDLGVDGVNPITITTTELATGLALTEAKGAIINVGSLGLIVLGVVTRAHTYVSKNVGGIIYDDGYLNVVSSGQNADVLQRGSIYVKIEGLLVSGATSAAMYSVVYSRDTDGAVFLGDVAGSAYTGYTKTNFTVTSLASLNVIGGVVRIANDEMVGVA